MKKLLFLFCILTGISFQLLYAQNNAVMISDQCLYLGKKSFLPPGVYQSNQLGINDNSVSSFHVPKGLALQVFENDKFMGSTETFYSSVACLRSTWNNKISSIKVYLINDPGNEGGSGGNIPPQGDRVIFYKDIKYSGMSRDVGAGNFIAGTLGFLADNASSIYIPPGYMVKVNDPNGQTQTFTSSVSNLAQYGWDNRINSGFIERKSTDGGGDGTLPPQGDRVIFYRDMKYSGMARVFAIGNFNPTSLGFLSENISSIYIPNGQSVKVYDRANRSHTFTTSVSDLQQNGWDDRISTGIISGSSGGTLPPQGDKVIFYRDMKYSGMAKEFNFGIITYSTLGFLTNNISSMYIPQGWAVQVRDSRGSVQTFTSSISDLAQYGWDNKIYSCHISNNSGGQHGGNMMVNLYTDPNYRGNSKPYGEGPINYIGEGAAKNISSIQVPPGFAITVYDGQNLTGSNITFIRSVTNLSQYGWNDRISSVYVFRQ